MAQPVTVYRWDDAGAPQVTDGRPSEYLDIIKKCLVDGYGAKLSLGWLTVLDEHLSVAPYLALKNDTVKGASGGVITFSAADDIAGTFTKVQSCQSFIDKDNLINASSSFVYRNPYNTETQILKNWMLIGTDSAFYFFVTPIELSNQNYLSSYACISFFTGDFKSHFSNDPARFVSIASSSSDVNTHGWSNMLTGKLGFNSGDSITNIYPLDNSGAAISHSIISLLGNVGYVNNRPEISAATPDISVLVECYLMLGSDPYRHQNADYLNSQTHPWLRGKMPGLFFSLEAGYRDVPMPHVKSINNINYFQMPAASSNVSCVWINLEQW